MGSSERKRAANRKNGQKSDGPKNTANTRHNATKHALTAKGLTDLDDAEGYHRVLDDLNKSLKPRDELSRFLIETVALETVRVRRARRLEAEFLNGLLHPARYQGNPPLPDIFKGTPDEIKPPTLIDPGLPPSIDVQDIGKLAVYSRYESTSLKNFYRALHEHERLERMRQGEHVPAPIALDVTIDEGSGPLLSPPAASEETEASCQDGERRPTSVIAARNISPSVPRSPSVNPLPENVNASTAAGSEEREASCQGGESGPTSTDARHISASAPSSEQSWVNPLSAELPDADNPSGIKPNLPVPWTSRPSPGPLWRKSRRSLLHVIRTSNPA
jgi:hypothetical protein